MKEKQKGQAVALILVILALLTLCGSVFYIKMELYKPETWEKMKLDPLYPVKVMQCGNMATSTNSPQWEIKDGKCWIQSPDKGWIDSDSYYEQGHD